jgi:hypothetical protein
MRLLACSMSIRRAQKNVMGDRAAVEGQLPLIIRVEEDVSSIQSRSFCDFIVH